MDIIDNILHEARINKQMQIVKKADEYDDEVHPNNKKFWKNLPKNKGNSLSKHPVFTLSGEELDRASYKHTKNLSKEKNINVHELQSVFMKMLKIEHNHKEELEKLAISAVAKLMGVDESELEAKLSNDVESNDTEPLTSKEIKDMSPKLLDEANKRITSNAFSQGASVHGYLTAHFIEDIEKKIKKIAPELIDMYSKMSIGSHLLYWMMDMSQMNLSSAAVGSATPKQDEDGKFKVLAVSPIFIVLVQELIKGILEIRYLKGLQAKSQEELSDDDIRKIFQYADKIEDEPKLIQIGPELWRRFLKVYSNSGIKKSKTLVEVYEELMKLPPKELHEFVEKVVNDTSKAHKLLESLLSDDSNEEIEKLIKSSSKEKNSAVLSAPAAPAPVKTPVTEPTKTPMPTVKPRIIPLPKPKNEF